jgi:hypothetical protein
MSTMPFACHLLFLKFVNFTSISMAVSYHKIDFHHFLLPEFSLDTYIWLNSWTLHLRHPRVTVTRQSDSALFTLGLILAKSTPLATRRKVANHSPWTPRGKQTSSKDIWSGDFPFLSNTFTHLHRGHFRYACTWGIGLLPDRVLKLLVRGSHCTLCMVCAVDALAVSSYEHTSLSEIVVWLQGSKESSLPGRMT